MKVEIYKLNHQGKGITYIDNKIVFVNNVLPGEIVNIKILKNNKNYMTAEVMNYIKTSPERIDNKCIYFGKCGGCCFDNVHYNYELEFKENKIKEIIKKYTSINVKKINNIVKSEKEYNYRNKATFKIKNKKLGYFKELSNDFIEIKNCLLCDEKINKKLSEKKLNKVSEKIIKSFDRYIKFDKCKFKVSQNSFFQINTNQAINIYSKINDYIKTLKDPKVLDLFCGVGSISIFISESSKEVLGIEINEGSIKDAIKNIKLNNIKNVNFISYDVNKIINDIDFVPNVVIVDPPRSGLDKILIENLLESNVKDIIYLSCDPMTLARDLNLLNKKYEVISITPYDMFPKTFHVETLTFLKLK